MNFENGYRTCFIAFLDILGFKKKIEKLSCQEILDIFRDIKQPLKSGKVKENDEVRDIPAASKVCFKVMSDSICMYVDADLPDALLCLIMACDIFQAKLLRRVEPIFVRGAIVYGNIYAKDDITFGPGMTQAYLLEEKNAQYPRIIMTRDTIAEGEKKASSPIMLEHLQRSVNCDFDRYYVSKPFDALLMLEPDTEADTVSVRYTRLMDHITKTLNSTTDPSIREKYIYTENKLIQYEGIFTNA